VVGVLEEEEEEEEEEEWVVGKRNLISFAASTNHVHRYASNDLADLQCCQQFERGNSTIE
jgi:murein endopeptidase